MKWLILIVLLFGSSSMAQVVGRLSYIEPDAKPEILTRGDPRRLPTGFVEVLHDARLEACKRQNYDRCQTYEWSIPFMPQSVAEKVERGLSEAWNRFDARMFWRIQTEINGIGAYLTNCGLGVLNLDLLLGVWDKNLLSTMPASDFCDDLNPEWFLYITSFCSLMDTFTFWDRVTQAYARAYTHALVRYYPEYWADVLKVIAINIPLALWWDGVYPVLPGQMSGLVLQPITNLPNPQQYLNLALEAQKQDLRGFAYVLARYPFFDLLGTDITLSIQNTVQRLPLETQRDGEPGLEKLEMLKYGLSKREGIFSRPFQWADFFDTPKPKGLSGAATLYEYAGVGHAVFFTLQSNFITEVSPRIPIFWRTCLTESIPPVPIPVPVPMPMVQANSRVDTGWQSVPEGYPIRDVKGVPMF